MFLLDIPRYPVLNIPYSVNPPPPQKKKKKKKNKKKKKKFFLGLWDIGI